MSDKNLHVADRYPGQLDRLSNNALSPFQALKDEELVVRAQNDDPWAIELLIRRYQKKVYSIAYQMCFADGEEAKDRTQEAFLQIFRNIKQFKGKSSFFTWLYRITVNTCIDAQRKRRRWRHIFFSRRFGKNEEEEFNSSLEEYPSRDENSNPHSALSHQQLEKKVKNAVKSLSEKQRTVFQLKIFQEMSIHEIAETMGLAEGTVKTHLFRATQSVQNQLHEWIKP